MDLKEFSIIVDNHSVLPGNHLYNSNALAGEVGEIANIVKKIELFKLNPDFIADKTLTLAMFEEKLLDELGDALFYLIRKIKDTGKTPEEIMELQTWKLQRQSVEWNRIFKK